jgi:hypothetical protein
LKKEAKNFHPFALALRPDWKISAIMNRQKFFGSRGRRLRSVFLKKNG